MEVSAETTYVPHHKQKIVLILAAMRHFAAALAAEGIVVDYVRLNDPANTGNFTGEMLRAEVKARTPTGIDAASYMDQGRLVPDQLIVGMVSRRLQAPDCRTGCLLDGFPRTLIQAETLDDLLERRAMSVDGVIELAVPRDELVRRMLARKREDDDPEVFSKRITSFEVQTAPLLDYYAQQGKLASIDGLGTADEIFERVKAAVKRFERAARTR
jgi:adenylate kinase